ncbi:hypothetical protein ABVT39_017371 [Epinephelus coioides]
MPGYQDIDLLTEARATTLAFSDSNSDSILSLFPQEDVLSSSYAAPSLSQRLEYLLKKEVRTSLHSSTLSHYWRNKRIPGGFRINKEPALGRDNISKTRAEIADIRSEMKTKLTTQQTQGVEDKCTAVKDSFEKQLSETKLNKYRRDTLDYKNGRVYPWLSSKGHTAHRHWRRRDEFTASSEPSTGESGNERPTAGTRRWRRFLEAPPARSIVMDITYVVCKTCNQSKVQGEFSEEKVWSELKLDYLKRHVGTKGHLNAVEIVKRRKQELGIGSLLQESTEEWQRRNEMLLKQKSDPEQVKILIDNDN